MKKELIAGLTGAALIAALWSPVGVAVAVPPAAHPVQVAALAPAVTAGANASGVSFPGSAPGAASLKADAATSAYVFANKALELTLARHGEVFVPSLLRNKLSRIDRTIEPGEFFIGTLADGTKISSDDLRLVSAPTVSAIAPDSNRGADRGKVSNAEAGQRLRAEYEFTVDDKPVRLTWTAELRTDANYVNQFFTVTPVAGQSVNFTRLSFLNVGLGNARQIGRDDGNPVAVGEPGHEDVFFGLENPMSKASVAADGFGFSVPAKLAVTAAAPYSASTAVGVSAPGQLRRSFGYYVERERASQRRTYLHYQSWYDNRITNEQLNQPQLAASMKIFGDALTERGTTVDGYFIDSGWDYKRKPLVEQDAQLKLWDFDPTQFPNGFKELKSQVEEQGSHLGVWMSPFGGYDTAFVLRKQLNASRPEAERFETTADGRFKLSGPKYYAWFKKQAFSMMDEQGVTAFKLDGIGGGLGQTGPNTAFLDDYEALLRLSKDLRAHQPKVWINATVGTWASPYWLWYVDSIWRDGGDVGYTGSGSAMERNTTYRDQVSLASRQLRSPLLPMNSIMNHGFIFSDGVNGPWNQNTDLTDPAVVKDVNASAKAYFGLGLGLQELYVRPALASPSTPGAPALWDAIAKNATWARENQNLLSDVRMVGGSPSAGEAYGTASWNAEAGGQGVLMVRNPSDGERSITLRPSQLFELPTGSTPRYAFTERDGQAERFVADTARPKVLSLKPHEVLIFEAKATADAVTEPYRQPDLVTLPRTGWTATATSQETAGEDGRASNVLDGNSGTIWHSAWANPTLPQTITIDTTQLTSFDTVRLQQRAGSGAPINGVVKGYTLETSIDGANWSPGATGEFSSWESLDVKVPRVTARYVRVTVTSTLNGKPYAALAEVNLLDSQAATAPPEGRPAVLMTGTEAPSALSAVSLPKKAPSGRTVTVADLPPHTWLYAQVQRQDGTASASAARRSEGWVRSDEQGRATVKLPTQPGKYMVVVQDQQGLLVASGSVQLTPQG